MFVSDKIVSIFTEKLKTDEPIHICIPHLHYTGTVRVTVNGTQHWFVTIYNYCVAPEVFCIKKKYLNHTIKISAGAIVVTAKVPAPEDFSLLSLHHHIFVVCFFCRGG